MRSVRNSIPTFPLLVAVAALLAVLASTSRAAEPVPSRATVSPEDAALRSVRADLIARVESGDLPSISIGVVHGDEVKWLEGIGWADRERRIHARPSTVYSLGSLSKSITATALMRLVDSGRLRLDDPVRRFGLRFANPLGFAEEVRLRHLLQMTGGIAHGKWHVPVDSVQAASGLARAVERYGGPVSAPGERFLYSNLSYGALETVIAQASGTPFETFLRAELFEPLGMRRSGGTLDPAWEPQVARKYRSDGRPLTADYAFLPRGGGGLYSTATDLVRYAQLHLGTLEADAPLTAVSIQRLHDPSQPGEPSHGRYMGGWGFVDDGFSISLLSDGQVSGSNTALLLVPAESLGVVCLVNRSGNDALPAAIEIVNALRPGYRDAFLQYVESMGAVESGGGVNRLERLAGTWAGRIWLGSDSLDVQLAVSRAGEVRWRIAGVGEGTMGGAFHSDRPDTVVHGIRFRSPGFSGSIAGVNVLERWLEADAWLDLDLKPEGDALVGSGINVVGDDSFPAVVRLDRRSPSPN